MLERHLQVLFAQVEWDTFAQPYTKKPASKAGFLHIRFQPTAAPSFPIRGRWINLRRTDGDLA